MNSTTVDTAYTERFILAQDGLSLYTRDYEPPREDGTAVLCLAGMTRNSKDFAHIARVLSPRRRVICPDYRGRGRSEYDSNWRNYEPMVYLNDVLHLLTALDVHRVAIIGTSLGGLLAMALAIARPGAVAGVVLNDIGPEIGPGSLGHILDYVAHDQPQPDWPSATAEIRRMFGFLELGDPANWERMARATYKECPDGMLRFDWDVRLVRPFRKALRRQVDLWPYFRALKSVPVLAVRGGKSAVLLPDCLERMKAEKPDLLTATVPGVGHTPNLGEPAAVAALDEFFARVP
jgi:pimeloyl-ACP methyl ester carboxylesterase